ncbi:MAG: tape measure protein [Candidatus Nanoarchaeia archaeon]|nr:tape measure protein [Candidatus Nanoarchaeia archaeon]
MNTLGEMIVKLKGDNSDFDTKIEKTKKKFEESAKAFETVGKKLSLFVTAPLIGLGAAALKSSAEIEMITASFTTMLGNEKEAIALMNDIKVMAAKTPFETTGLADATKTLLQFGIESDKVIETLSMLGDISGGSSSKLSSLALVFGQIQSTGRLMGQDLLQLINVGFNPLQIISEKTGKSMAVLKDEMSKGKISAQDVAEAFESATKEGGKFYKGMETASKTLSGVWSTLKDDAGELGRSFADILLPSIKDVVKGFSELLKGINDLSPVAKENILIIAGVAATMGPLALGINGVMKVLPGLITVLKTGLTPTGIAGLVIVGVAAVAAGILILANNIKNARIEQEDLNKVLHGGTTGTWSKDLELVNDRLIKVNKEIEKSNNMVEAGNNFEITRLNQLKEERELLNKTKAELAEKQKWQALNQRGQDEMNKQVTTESLTQNQINEALEIRQKITEKYLGARENVLSVLEGEKSEYQKIEDQIKKLEETPWAKGKLEDDRLEAIRILRQKQQEILDEEKEAEEKLAQDESKIWVDAETHKYELSRNGLDDQLKLLQEENEATRIAEEENIKIRKEANEFVLSSFIDLFKSLGSIASSYYQNQINNIDAKLNAELDANDKALQDALRAAGVANLTVLESAQKQLNILKEKLLKAKDAEEKAALQEQIREQEKAVKKAEIEETYADKKKEIEEDLIKKKYKLQKAAFEVEKKMTLAQIAIDTVMGITKIWAQSGINVILAGILTAAMAAVGIRNAGIVNDQEYPPLALKDGALIMPKPGGTNAVVAEAGVPELVVPLDKLGSVLSDIKSNINQSQMIHIIQNIDGKPILDLIFPATQNRTILIDNGAIV